MLKMGFFQFLIVLGILSFLYAYFKIPVIEDIETTITMNVKVRFVDGEPQLFLLE